MRSHYCGHVNESLIDQQVTLCGWVHRRRDHGGVIFIDLRDREGRVQVVFDPDAAETFAHAERVRSEYVLQVRGRVRRRPEGTANPELPTGEIEVLAAQLEILSVAETPPFHLDDDTVSEEHRLRYRYIDLRRPEMQQRIRLRALDPMHALLPGLGQADITLDAESFARLTPSVSRVFITENEVNYLAFPQVLDSLLIFGAGYGFEGLAQAAWLTRCQVFYWGDIDTHGFAILDQLRTYLPHVRSLLMDRATLLAFEAQWGVEDKQTLRNLPHLNVEECALYDELRDNRLSPNLRLEQERIGFGWVEASLAGLETADKVDTA